MKTTNQVDSLGHICWLFLPAHFDEVRDFMDRTGKANGQLADPKGAIMNWGSW